MGAFRRVCHGLLAISASGVLLAQVMPAAAAPLDAAVPVWVNPAFAYGPSGGTGYASFSASSVARPKHFNTYLLADSSSTAMRVNAPGTSGGVAGIDGDRVVYAQHSKGGSVDLQLYAISTATRSDPPDGVNTDLDEVDPSLSGDWLLFSRTGGGPRQRTSSVVLHNLVTGEERTLARGCCVFSEQVRGDFVAYTKGVNEFRYDIAADTATKLPQPGKGVYGAGSVTSDGTVYVAHGKRGCGEAFQIRRIDPDDTVTVIFEYPAKEQIAWKTFAVETGTGTSVFFDRYSCRTGDSDIFRLDGADTATGPITALRVPG